MARGVLYRIYDFSRPFDAFSSKLPVDTVYSSNVDRQMKWKQSNNTILKTIWVRTYLSGKSVL